MALIPTAELPVARAIAQLGFANPFLPERIELERQALGSEFRATGAVWEPPADGRGATENLERIGDVATALVERLRERVLAGTKPRPDERSLYQDLCLYALYHRYRDEFGDLATRAPTARRSPRAQFFEQFVRDCARLFDATDIEMPHGHTPARLFACFFQVRRAFHHTFHSIAGGSLPVARLRAQVWQSVFTHDLRRYQRALFDRMGDVTTLVTGPSGAGKELVARAIARSRFVPFDVATRSFPGAFEGVFFPLNLSALSETLIESELFGHTRGAFTGAVGDRTGWLDVCPATGSVFLDEIGETTAAVQVKLLRVLETRTFQPLGTSTDRPFRGKIVAATNRDLGEELRAGRFREDLYYRLCADRVVAPSLRERLDDSPAELSTLVRFLSARLVGEEESAGLATEAEEWIDANLGSTYAWPGNVRELLHCVSNVMIHRDYRPADSALAGRTAQDARAALAAELAAGTLTAEQVLSRYCTLVFADAGSYVAAANRLGIDRRTVRARVDEELLQRLRAG